MKETVRKIGILEPMDIEAIAVNKDHYFRNAYIIDLPLETTPDHVWQDIFEQQWKSSRHLWDRKLFVIGDKLRLLTTQMDMEDKLAWVKDMIDRTNKRIDEYNQEMESRTVHMEDQMKLRVPEDDKLADSIREVVRRRFGTY